MTLYREERYSGLVSRTVLKTSLDWKQFELSLTKYWQKADKRKWVFKTNKSRLQRMSDTKIVRHIKVKSEHHIFDGQDEYWVKRRFMNKTGKKTRKEVRLIKQKFRCNICKELFKHDSIMELDHIIPKHCGGLESVDNLQVLHRHCHDSKSSNDGSYNKEWQKPRV